MTARRHATRPVPQRSLAWVQQSSPEQIDDALRAGELATVLGAETVPVGVLWTDVQWSAADVAAASRDQIADATAAGLLNDYYAGKPPPRQWSEAEFDAAADEDIAAAGRSGALVELAEEWADES